MLTEKQMKEIQKEQAKEMIAFRSTHNKEEESKKVFEQLRSLLAETTVLVYHTVGCKWQGVVRFNSAKSWGGRNKDE